MPVAHRFMLPSQLASTCTWISIPPIHYLQAYILYVYLAIEDISAHYTVGTLVSLERIKFTSTSSTSNHSVCYYRPCSCREMNDTVTVTMKTRMKECWYDGPKGYVSYADGQLTSPLVSNTSQPGRYNDWQEVFYFFVQRRASLYDSEYCYHLTNLRLVTLSYAGVLLCYIGIGDYRSKEYDIM